MDESEIDKLKRHSDYFGQYAKIAQSEVSTLSRWLTASLLAINGGGALAIASAAHSTPGLVGAGSMFVGGIAAALASGWFNQTVTHKFIGPATTLEKYYAEAAFNRARDREFEEKQNDAILKLARMTPAGPACGFHSFLLFAAACFSMGTAIEKSRDEIAPICQRLQSEMMGQRPERIEARERYEALQCAK